MSLTIIAMTGILLGFVCLVVGFFMDDSQEVRSASVVHRKPASKPRKKTLVSKRKAA
jgi:hypothetical protein